METTKAKIKRGGVAAHQAVWQLALRMVRDSEREGWRREVAPSVAYVQAWDADRFQGVVVR